ncbi:MAG TPA: GNAT family N-acetyltransferase [Opitutaceae bacterium]
MKLSFLSLAEYGLERAADVLTRGFADYFVRIPFSAAALLQLARTDSVDLSESRVVLREGAAVGAALIARRGWTSRLAGMSLVPEARRQGVGRATILHLLAEAEARGERAMVLEVIEQNAPAVALYQACGFRSVRRLVGFAHGRETEQAVAGVAAERLEEVDLRAMAAVVAAAGVPDLPWQLAAETIAHLTPPSAAFRLADAWVAVSDVAMAEVAIRGLAVAGGEPLAAPGTALLRALLAQYPGKRWQMKAIWPEELGGVFAHAGFARTELSQWQMLRRLGKP